MNSFPVSHYPRYSTLNCTATFDPRSIRKRRFSLNNIQDFRAKWGVDLMVELFYSSRKSPKTVPIGIPIDVEYCGSIIKGRSPRLKHNPLH